MDIYLNPSARALYSEYKTLTYGSKYSVGLDLAANLYNIQDPNTARFIKWNTDKVTDPDKTHLEPPHLELEFLDQVLVPTGVHIRGDLLHFGLIALRSGFATKKGCQLTNGIGVIDPDYRGELFISIKCFSKSKIKIEHGERIAQLLFVPYRQEPTNRFNIIDSLEIFNDTERGAGGFGSTGE